MVFSVVTPLWPIGLWFSINVLKTYAPMSSIQILITIILLVTTVVGTHGPLKLGKIMPVSIVHIQIGQYLEVVLKML